MTITSRTLFGSVAAAGLRTAAPRVHVAVATGASCPYTRRYTLAANIASHVPAGPTSDPQQWQQTRQQSADSDVNTNTAKDWNAMHRACRPLAHVPSAGSAGTDVEVAERLRDFRKFYEVVSKTTELAPTQLGHGGSERILNNSFLHRTPWQASCVELREKPHAAHDGRVLSYGQIDFASLRRRNNGGTQGSDVAASRQRYAHVDSCGAPAEGEAAQELEEVAADTRPSRLEVVHYYETSSAAGLAGYQSVAMMVRKGLLPGRTENYSAEGGFAVWVVPHADYVSLLTNQGLLEA